MSSSLSLFNSMFGVQWKRRVTRMLSFLFAFLSLVLLIPHLLQPKIADLTELKKCPACYGVSLCHAITEGHVLLNSFGEIAGLINMVGSKNVLFGMFGDRKIVIKKLGHMAELEEFDNMCCKQAGMNPGCHVSEAVWQQGDLLSLIEQHVLQPLVTQDDSTITSGLRLCPTTVNLEHLLRNVYQRNKDVDLKDLHANIWTIIKINPEPLILQILQEEDGWPVPKYVGACGRVVVEEYGGEMLTTYYLAPWLQRAHLAHQLLIAAYNFTNSHPHFRFYLTDISPDNIAVDVQGILRFIDLENVVIVDKNVHDKEKPMSWNIPHESENFDCDGCFAFSPDDICVHSISDHNFYAVCQHLLGPLADPDTMPGGLLHGTPPVHAHLLDLLQQCSQPVKHGERLRAAQELTVVLAEVLKQNNYTS